MCGRVICNRAPADDKLGCFQPLAMIPTVHPKYLYACIFVYTGAYIHTINYEALKVEVKGVHLKH